MPRPSGVRYMEPSMLCALVQRAFRQRTGMHGESADRASPLASCAFPALLFFSTAHGQVRTNERLQIAIEHAVNVTYFQFCPVILDHPVGLQHVGTNLRSELNIELRVLDFLRGRAFLLHLKLVKL